MLHALCDLADHATNPEEVEAVYHLVSKVHWEDAFGEREDLLARLAFLKWNRCRKAEQYSEAHSWRKRCAQHALAQEHIRAFISSSFDERSPQLNSRFLGDETIVLTCWESLDVERNGNAREVAREATRLCDWLEEYGVDSGLEAELVHFLAAGASCTAMIAQNYLGCWDGWSQRAGKTRQHAILSDGNSELLALLDTAEAIRLCHRYESARAEAIARDLVGRYESMQLFDQAAKARFLLARVVKDQGRSLEAVGLFEEVSLAAVETGDLGLQCLALCQRAQALGCQGEFEAALRLVAEAIPLSRRSGCPWTEADVQGTVGELLRDSGDLIGSIAAYSSALRCYERLGMAGLAAYLGVILAETLLLAGRPAEAVSHIVVALRVIEKERIPKEAVVAIGLLGEALRRQKADPDALRQLREQLERMKEEGRL